MTEALPYILLPKTSEIRDLFNRFEAVASEYEGVECWSARELQELLGYSQWRNFTNAIDKAKESCENAGENVSYHFADVSKTIAMPKGDQALFNLSTSQLKRYERKIENNQINRMRSAICLPRFIYCEGGINEEQLKQHVVTKPSFGQHNERNNREYDAKNSNRHSNHQQAKATLAKRNQRKTTDNTQCEHAI